MGKATGKHYESKGERRNVSKDIVRAMRKERKADYLQTMLNKLNAWKKGKRVLVNGRNARDVWGDPRDSGMKYLSRD